MILFSSGSVGLHVRGVRGEHGQVRRKGDGLFYLRGDGAHPAHTDLLLPRLRRAHTHRHHVVSKTDQSGFNICHSVVRTF